MTITRVFMGGMLAVSIVPATIAYLGAWAIHVYCYAFFEATPGGPAGRWPFCPQRGELARREAQYVQRNVGNRWTEP